MPHMLWGIFVILGFTTHQNLTFDMKTDFLHFACQIISAQQLPKINTEKASSIVDPQVVVEIHGVSIDNAKQKTHRIDNNGNSEMPQFT